MTDPPRDLIHALAAEYPDVRDARALWERAAKEIYRQWKYRDELRPGVEACKDLLPKWERYLLSWGTKAASGASNDAPLVNRVAELGADLASDRLEDLWERAGGERKHLKTGGSADVRWREAAMLAQKGALSGGLVALVRELQADLPHNEALKELEGLLTKQR